MRMFLVVWAGLIALAWVLGAVARWFLNNPEGLPYVVAVVGCGSLAALIVAPISASDFDEEE